MKRASTRTVVTILSAIQLLTSAFSFHATASQAEPAQDVPGWYALSTIPGDSDISSVAFANSMDGYAVGDSGAMYLTHNGGASWSTYITNSKDNLSGTGFFDAVHGAVIGSSTLLITSDAGHTWQHISIPNIPVPGSDIVQAAGDLTSVSMTLSGVIYAVFYGCDGSGHGDQIFASTDWGTTWAYLGNGTEDNNYCDDASVDHITFSSPTEGWAYGIVQGDIPQYSVEHTTDRGLTWQQINFQAGVLRLWVRGSTLLALMQDSQGMYLAQSTDDGQSFDRHALPPSIKGKITSLHFASVQQGALSTDSGQIFTTYDGGQSWQMTAMSFVGLAPIAPAIVSFAGGAVFVLTKDRRFMYYGSPPTVPTASPTAVQPIPNPPPTAIPAVPPLRLSGIAPDHIVSTSHQSLVVYGTGFDDAATISLGDLDITDVTANSSASAAQGQPDELQFTLPAYVTPGTYAVTVTEPDGRVATLHRALTILAPLAMKAHFLRASAVVGGSAVLLVVTAPTTKVSVTVTTATGHATPHITIRALSVKSGQWRVTLTIGAKVAPGTYKVTVLVRSLGQSVSSTLALAIRSNLEVTQNGTEVRGA